MQEWFLGETRMSWLIPIGHICHHSQTCILIAGPWWSESGIRKSSGLTKGIGVGRTCRHLSGPVRALYSQPLALCLGHCVLFFWLLPVVLGKRSRTRIICLKRLKVGLVKEEIGRVNGSR